MRPSRTILVLEELRKSSSVLLRRKGVELSFDDSRTVTDVYQQWLLLMIDLGYLHLEDLERTSRRLWSDMLQADVLDLNNAFAECLQLVRLQTNKGFKALCKRISPHLYNLMKDDMDKVLLGDVYAAKRMMQAFAYTSRLSLTDIDLTQQMLSDYLAVEDSILETYPKALLQNLNRKIRRWMASFDPNNLRPHHGRKGVAFLGRASYEDKYKDLSTDSMLRYAYGDPWWIDSPIRSCLERISETTFVPKSYKTFRTISMEPSTLMYFQQGVWREIDRLVYSDNFLRNRIGFHDQNRNKALARTASINRDYATIDLSAASDSVSYQLVKELFRGTKILRYLIATRSKRTFLPDGRVITLKKFAPMGSAVCFPTETIIFAAICDLVTENLGERGRYSVYGDDIIIPTRCAESAIRILETLGFRVNREKSYYHRSCWFRESCGGEFCDGFDVTPMRVSRKYASRADDVRLEALIDMANNAYIHGFRYLRTFFIQRMRANKWTPLFSPDALLSDNYTNYHTKKRWNKNLQRIEVRVSDFSLRFSRKELAQQDESIRYRHWLENTYQRVSADSDYESIVCQPTKFVKEAWRAKPYESSDQAFIDQHTGRG